MLTISKYSSARPPVLPTFFMSSMPAMPTTTVQKMIGAMIILISLMKPSPSGFIAVAGLGVEVAQQHADDDGGDDLEVERLVERLVGRAFASSFEIRLQVPLMRLRGAGCERLSVRVIAGADQWATCHVREPHVTRELLQPTEILRCHIAAYGQIARARLQVLTHGEHVHAVVIRSRITSMTSS